MILERKTGLNIYNKYKVVLRLTFRLFTTFLPPDKAMRSIAGRQKWVWSECVFYAPTSQSPNDTDGVADFIFYSN
jgi:hypothetical protein